MEAESHRPPREVQALEQVGATVLSRGVAWGLAVAFALTVIGVAVCEPFAERFDSPPSTAGDPSPVYFRTFSELAREVRGAFQHPVHEGFLAVNRSLLAAIHRFEDSLKDRSFLRRWLLPRLQWRLAASLGLGNEQVYIGREGWLFFRSDVDSVIGRGFLEPTAQQSRKRGGDSWLRPPEADPLPALLDFQRQLQARQIHLIVMPTPVKPTVEGERFSPRVRGVARALHNPSFEELLDRLLASGIDVFDPTPLLIEARIESGDDQYLRTDTHWTPSAVEVTARELASRVASLLPEVPTGPGSFSHRPVVVEGFGDIAGMLWLPPDQAWIMPERQTPQRVLTRDGRGWRADKKSEVLLLGDSFANVYSDPSLGWGAGAGLAEQLSFFLQRPVDKLAVNAGGALQSRRTLQRLRASGDDRLTGKKVLVYQFAARELAQGDWQLVELAASETATR